MHADYKTYSQFLSEKFPDYGKIQKIGVSVGYSCPNRDGTIGRGGCAYCNNASFFPDYESKTEESYATHEDEIARTLELGKRFFARKYPAMKYLAYFQSYTNTHGASVDTLMRLYERAAKVEDVVGLVIGTRPDCVPDELLDKLAEMNSTVCPVLLEFGAESSHNSTLDAVNRCHHWETTVDAVHRAAERKLSVGLHFIMGLPGETRQMMLETVHRSVELPVETLKFHQLQIIEGTRFADMWRQNPDYFDLFTPEAYAALCREIISIVSPTGIAVERFVSQAPDNLLIAPRWGLKNYQFVNLLGKI